MNKFVIIRDDLPIDPVTVISDGLLIGRLPQCEVLLNHPSVSRIQAGIKQVGDNYYLFALRPRNPVLLNGRPVEENEALAPGDIIEVGPFQSEIDVSDPGVTTDQLIMVPDGKEKKPRPQPVAGTKALDIFWDKRMREVGKMFRPSPLYP